MYIPGCFGCGSSNGVVQPTTGTGLGNFYNPNNPLNTPIIEIGPNGTITTAMNLNVNNAVRDALSPCCNKTGGNRPHKTKQTKRRNSKTTNKKKRKRRTTYNKKKSR